MNKYHQQGASLDNFDQNFDIFSGENDNYHRISNQYFQYEIAVKKDATDPADCH